MFERSLKTNLHVQVQSNLAVITRKERRLLLRRRRRQSVCSRFVINESLLSPKVGLQLLKRYNKLAETFLVSRNFKIGLNLVLSTSKMKHVKTFNCFNLMMLKTVEGRLTNKGLIKN